MRLLKHHPGILMRNDAADALDALEDKYGPIIINRGSVSESVQQGLIDRWNKGGPANRPPFLFQPKSPARASDHVQGIGLDVYNYTDDRAKLKEFGFEWYGKSDPVHYTFRGWNKPVPSAVPKEEEIEMPTGYYIKARGNAAVYWIDQQTGKKRSVTLGELNAAQEFNRATNGKTGAGFVATVTQSELDAIPNA